MLAAGIGTSMLVSGGFAHAQQADTTPPTIPSGIAATLQQSLQVYISWTPSTDPDSPVEGYYLYRNGIFIASIPGQTSYVDSPAPGAQTYTVTSYDSAGNISAKSQSATITVPRDTIPPTTPGNLTAKVSSSSVTLSWTASTDNIAVVGYYVSRNGVRLQTPSAITGTSYKDTGLAPGITYSYGVSAYDASQYASDNASITATTIYDIVPPSAPSGLTAKAFPNQINVAWLPSTDNNQVSGYFVYRNGSKVADVASATYSDVNLPSQTAYVYTIVAYDIVSNLSGPSTPLNTGTLPPDVYPPTIPQGFFATPLSGSSVRLTWQPSTDDVQLVGYNIFRDDVKIASTASTTYIDTGLTGNSLYNYGLNAYDEANLSSAKTTLAVTTLSPTSPPPVVTPPAPAPTPTPIPAPTPAPAPVPVATTPPILSKPPVLQPPQTSAGTLAANLSPGSRGSSVLLLQLTLVRLGYLNASNATGYFGALTQSALKKFQCEKSIVCFGLPGWGTLGPRTRAVLNKAL